MRALSADLRASMAREDMSVCILFELSLADTTVCRYTSNSDPIMFSADGKPLEIWHAAPGIKLSAIRDTTDALSQTATIEIGYFSGLVTEETARKGGMSGAGFRVLVIDYLRPELGYFVLFAGKVDRCTASNKYSCSIDLTGFQSKSTQITGVYSLKCRHVFCDKGCGLSLADFSTEFTVDGDSSDGATFTADPAPGDGTLSYGSVLWVSGRNAGLTSMIAGNAGSSVSLLVGPPYAPQDGDTGVLRQGCDFYAETCENRFNNLKNLGAEPAVPNGTETKAAESTSTVVNDPAKPGTRPDPVYTAASSFLPMAR